MAEPNVCTVARGGLKGTLAIRQASARTTRPRIVKIFWLDGQNRVYTLTAAQPKVQLYGSAEDDRGMGEIASAYTVLGIEHILERHTIICCSCFGLLFLVGFQRKLLWTITAFTAAHSLTLASAALGLLTLRSPPVEATIALSIVLVAARGAEQAADAGARAGRRSWRSCSVSCTGWGSPAR